MEPEGWRWWIPITSPPVRRLSMSWSCPLWAITIKRLTTSSKKGHPVLRALAHCGLLCLAKQYTFFFSILSKNLSSRFNSVAVYRLNFSYNGNNQKNSYKNWKRVLPLVLWRRVFHEFYVQTRVLLSDNSWTFLSLFPISSILHQPSYIFSVSTWIELLNMSPFPRSLAVE